MTVEEIQEVDVEVIVIACAYCGRRFTQTEIDRTARAELAYRRACSRCRKAGFRWQPDRGGLGDQAKS